jgi:hypothetical protein
MFIVICVGDYGFFLEEHSSIVGVVHLYFSLGTASFGALLGMLELGFDISVDLAVFVGVRQFLRLWSVGGVEGLGVIEHHGLLEMYPFGRRGSVCLLVGWLVVVGLHSYGRPQPLTSLDLVLGFDHAVRRFGFEVVIGFQIERLLMTALQRDFVGVTEEVAAVL